MRHACVAASVNAASKNGCGLCIAEFLFQVDLVHPEGRVAGWASGKADVCIAELLFPVGLALSSGTMYGAVAGGNLSS